ncbi:MAG TPA: DUF6702 family protein [Telluria sp.]
MFKSIISAAVLAAAALTSGSALAHRFHAGMTDVTQNARTGSVEIVHAYMAHDLEALVAQLNNGQSDLSQPEDEATLRTYMEQHFYLLSADNKRIPVRWVGMNASADMVLVYQEVEKTRLDSIARIHHSVLADVLPDQRNTVNLVGDGERRTLTFATGATEQAVSTGAR